MPTSSPGLAARWWGPLGSRHAVWHRKGAFFAPDWATVPLMAAGVVALVAASVFVMVD